MVLSASGFGKGLSFKGITPSVAFEDPRVPLVAAVGSGRPVILPGVEQEATAAITRIANI
jgi:hypothetical protein